MMTMISYNDDSGDNDDDDYVDDNDDNENGDDDEEEEDLEKEGVNQIGPKDAFLRISYESPLCFMISILCILYYSSLYFMVNYMLPPARYCPLLLAPFPEPSPLLNTSL